MTTPTLIDSVPAEPLADPLATLRHFLDLARRGAPLGGSSGEEAAALLAEAVAAHVCALDDRAVDGLIGFVLLAKSRPTSAADLANGIPLDEVFRA